MTMSELTASLKVIEKELAKIGCIGCDIQPYTNKISIHLHERELPEGERKISDNYEYDNYEYDRESVMVDGIEFFRLVERERNNGKCNL